MATITKTIGSTSRDYSTVALWEADLDDDTPYDAGDDALGEMYDDSPFSVSGTTTINGGGTLNLNSVRLSVASGERHDGTEGTGARLVFSGAGQIDFFVPSGFSLLYTLEWFEIDKNGQNDHAIRTDSSQFNNVGIVRNMIIHGASGGSAFNGLIKANNRDVLLMNNIWYDQTRNSATDTKCIWVDADQAQGGVFNNTVFSVINTDAGNAIGIRLETDSANGTCKNNIAMDAEVDFEFAGTNPDSDFNLSSDATADDGGGASNVLSKASSDQFVSTTGGSEDLHLKSGADAIDVGVDLVDTPTNVKFDIDGTDRDANGDSWDIGAHLFIAAGGSAALTGTAISGGVLESEIVTGGDTIIITLTGDTWVAAGATFDAQRQNIIDGLDSAQSEAAGWNVEVRDKEVVGAVVRTSDTVVTVTLTAAAAYVITADETITVTVPATALVTSVSAIIATPTFDVTNETAGRIMSSLARYGGLAHKGGIAGSRGGLAA